MNKVYMEFTRDELLKLVHCLKHQITTHCTEYDVTADIQLCGRILDKLDYLRIDETSEKEQGEQV